MKEQATSAAHHQRKVRSTTCYSLCHVGSSVQNQTLHESVALSYTEGSPKPRSPTPVMISQQPLMLNSEQQLYNVRKLVELPNSLAKCGRLEELRNFLMDYNWLKASVHIMSCAELIECFSTILPIVPLGRYGTPNSTAI